MKKTIILMLAILMCFSITSCSKEDDWIELTNENFFDYITFNYEFEEITQNTDDYDCEKIYTSTILKISFFPKSEHKFKDISLTYNFEAKEALTEKWEYTVYNHGEKKHNGLVLQMNTANQRPLYNTLKLDKNGYGTSYIYFSIENSATKQYTGQHPIQFVDNDWLTLSSCSGYVM